MANRKPKLQINVPASGVRKDVNSMLLGPDMAAIGENCIFYDGVIRPRPALTSEVTDPLKIGSEGPQTPLANPYQKIYEGRGLEHRATSFIKTSNGYLLMAYVLGPSSNYTGDKWAISQDGGLNWTMDVALDKMGGKTPHFMQEIDGYIFAFTTDSLYRAPIASLPTSLTWETLATGMTGLNRIYSHIQYDYDHDTMLLQFQRQTWAVYNITKAAGPWTKEDLFPAATAYYPATANSTISPGSVVGNWYVIPVARDTFAPANSYVEQWLVAYPLSWDGSTYNIDLDSPEEIRMLATNQNPFTIPSPQYARVGTAMFDNGAIGGTSRGIVLVSASGDDFIISISLNSTGWVQDGQSWMRVPTWGGNVTDYVQTNVGMVAVARSGVTPYSDYRYPTYLISSDNGLTWMRFKYDDVYAEQRDASLPDWPDGEPMQQFEVFDWRVSVSDDLASFYLIAYCKYDDWIVADKGLDHPKIYVAPITKGGGGADLGGGDVTNIFQARMSDEDNVVFVGSTKALARLNRDTNTWTRITADSTEAKDTAPLHQWKEKSGGVADIPPLSAYADDAEYESGISIDGSFGEHPWSFRVFEAQGEPFLIATNGQCYPLIYHPDMPGGFARRLGEMTVDDPNYLAVPVNGEPNGDLAPRAKCIATAANRVMLANDPGGSPYSVAVGAFNDPDRGWGTSDFQFVLLADTPGEIISMNEISALQVAIYKEDAIYHAIAQTEFLGVSAPFRFELSKAGISGPCSPSSVLRNFDGRQIYLARDGGVYMYDGVAPLDGGRNIRRLIQNDINLNRLGKVWGMVDRKRKLVWFFYPSKSGLVNKGIVISTDQGYPWPAWPLSLPDGWDFTCGAEIRLETDISLRDLAILHTYDDTYTLDSFSSGRTEMLMGLKSGVLFSHKYDEDEKLYNDDGIPIQVHLQTGWVTPGEVGVYTADTIHHIFSCSDPAMELEVRLRAQQIGRNIRTSKVSMLSEGKIQRRTQHRVSGAQFSLDIRGGIDHMFSWGGAALSLVKRGGR